jgi:hypothetical protein
MPSLVKKTLRLILRWGVCVAALVFVLQGVQLNDTAPIETDPDAPQWIVEREDQSDPEDPIVHLLHPDTGEKSQVRQSELAGEIHYGVLSILKRSDKTLLLASILIFMPVPFFSAVRLKWMLNAQEVRLSLWESTKLTFAGNFFNFAVPGTTGGDLFKAYYISKHTDRKTEAVTTVFLDRAVGLIGLTLIGTFAILFRIDDPKMQKLGLSLGALLLTLVVGAIIFFSRRIRSAIRFDKIISMLPLKDQVQRIDRATFRMRSHKRIVLSALLVTGVIQFLAIASFVAAGRAIHMAHPLPAFFACLSASLLVAAIPLTPMSIGPMEAMFKLFFVGDLANSSQSIFLAIMVRLIQLVWALPGVLVPLSGAHLPPAEKLAELQDPQA